MRGAPLLLKFAAGGRAEGIGLVELGDVCQALSAFVPSFWSHLRHASTVIEEWQ